MRKIYYAIIVLLLVGLISCDDDDENVTNNINERNLIGAWNVEWFVRGEGQDTNFWTPGYFIALDGVAYSSGFKLNKDKSIQSVMDGELDIFLDNYKWKLDKKFLIFYEKYGKTDGLYLDSFYIDYLSAKNLKVNRSNKIFYNMNRID